MTRTFERISTGRGRELGAQLRVLRERAGYSGTDLAHILGWSASKLSRMEAGKSGIAERDVINFAAHCEAKPGHIDALVLLANESGDGQRLKSHDDGLSDELHTLIFHEQTAAQIYDCQPVFVPGLAQTEGYMRALFREMGTQDKALIDRWADARLSRQNVLRGLNAPEAMFFVHENALRMQVGSAQIMHEQMLNLLFLAGRPHICVRVIPCVAGARGIGNNTFGIFTYAEGGPVIYVENETTSEFLEKKDDVDHYHRVLNRVASVALDEPHSGELLATLASAYERQGEPQNDSDRPARDELAEE